MQQPTSAHKRPTASASASSLHNNSCSAAAVATDGGSGRCAHAATAPSSPSAAAAAAAAAAGAHAGHRQSGMNGAGMAVRLGALGVLIAIATLALTGLPSAYSQAFLPENMSDAMDASMFLTRFKEGAEKVGYADALQDPEFTGTIFAPVDQGFEALLQASKATWDDLLAANETLNKVVKFHIVPSAMYYPLTVLRKNMRLSTALDGYSLTINRDTPGIIHVYAVDKPETDPMNFATILQYQEIKGGKAVLYVVDKVLIPPAKPNARTAPAAAAKANKRKLL